MLFAAMVCGVNSAQAQVDPNVYPALAPTEINFGVMNITRGQTARLNVIYTKVVPIDSTIPPDPYVPPDPCYPPDTYVPPDPYRVTLSFIDSDGRVVAKNIVSLAKCRPALLDFSLVDPNARSMKVRAVVEIERNNSALLPAVMPSVEVFDNDTGQTGVLDPGSIYSFNPKPHPPGFGFFGIARNQTARLNLAYVGFHNPPGYHKPLGFQPAPVNVTMQFVNGDGRVMAESRQTVEYDKAVSFDFPAGAFPAGVRQRLRAIVIVAPGYGGIAPCVMPSVEVLDNDTGKTAVFYPGSEIGW